MVEFKNLEDLRCASCESVAISYFESLNIKYNKAKPWECLIENLKPFTEEELCMSVTSFLIKRGIISLKEDI